MSQLSTGEAFPDMTLETRDGQVQLSDRWREGPLVVAFMRHFG
jgi:peroxiredoxin